MSQMSSYEQMQVWRERRKAGYERFQQFAAVANSLNSIKTNEAIGMGNIVSKVAYQRISKKA
ncbi:MULTISPECIES: hypothetical protein [Devosia]|uniref:Uncharacterized protein n=1 Tax=Devosia equisanguinis TaxID=2490941 RepID=A0A3S4CSG9_9HYPH|nr:MULTISPECIES: hypothetical protein [Devosia]ODT50564.1 MAG: hypothetical protein ABS74_03355 [Pelagibacterium sp. SCN 63-126]VDS04882.1 hypothetical protein DEVEQU_02023 [Devosia equisanguinis]